MAALLVAFSGSVVVAGAAPPATRQGLARGHAHHSSMVTPVGPEEGAENAAVAVPHSASALANSAVVAQPGENGDDDLSAAVAGVFVSDLGPRHRFRHVAVVSPADTTPPAGASPTAPGGTDVALPLTGSSPALAPVPAAAPRIASHPGTSAPSHSGAGAAPSLHSLPLIPPASLPAPAQIVPAVTGFSIAPVIGLAICLVVLGALIGLRIARRPG